MKMNNLIRAPKAGKIAAVRAVVGQHVKHGDVLLEYESS
jgi:biotin carboxyl carrier protein